MPDPFSPSTPNIQFIPLGASLQRLEIGGRNIVLGFNSAGEYAHNPAHFGATIGRVANRVAGATLRAFAGRDWPLSLNNGRHCLHGGERGWGKVPWAGPEVVTVAVRGGGAVEGGGGVEGGEGGKGGEGKEGGEERTEVEAVRFRLRSPHGDQGFPGEVEATVTYTPYEKNGRFVLEMEYEAQLVGGAEETAVSITNHSYFNLGPGDTIDGTRITLPTNQHLDLDESGVPVSSTLTTHASVTPNVPFTLSVPSPSSSPPSSSSSSTTTTTATTTLPPTSDFDHCFIHPSTAPSTVPLDTRREALKLCAHAHHPTTGLHLDVSSTDPAFQFYTGRFVDVAARPDGSPRRGVGAGFCVEPGRYVDAVGREEWRGMVRLRRGAVYGSRIVYTAWKEEEGGK